MKQPLTPARSRKLALALLLLAAAILIAAASVPLILLHRHYDREIESLSDRLARYQRVAASRDAVVARAEALRGGDARRFFLKSSIPALAAGEIQELQKSLIDASGARLMSMQIQAPKDEGRYWRVAVTATIMGNMEAIQGIFQAIESGEPYLFIDNLNLRSLHGMPSPPGMTLAEGEVSAQFDVIGYAPQTQATPQ